MSGFRLPSIQRDQIPLYSPTLEATLPLDSPARRMRELLLSPVFAEFFESWECEYARNNGAPAYHPRDMVAIYVYGMLHKVRSTRQLEMACQMRIDFMWLVGGLTPDYSTIALFLTNHKARVSEIFQLSVRVGMKAGMIKMKKHSVDGSNFEASAGRGSVKSKSSIEVKLEEVNKVISDLEAEFDAIEKQESLLEDTESEWTRHKPDDKKRELERAEKQKERLQEALASIETRKDAPRTESAPDPKEVASISDPDSRVMRDKEGRSKPNYNGQIVVDAEKSMITACDVSDAPNDNGQLVTMLEQVKANCGGLPEQVLADAGFNSGRELKTLSEMPVDVYIDDKEKGAKTPEAKEAVKAVSEGRTLSLTQLEALPKRGKIFGRASFVLNAVGNFYTCPAGKTMHAVQNGQRQDRHGKFARTMYKTQKGECAQCPHSKLCCKNAEKGRQIERDEFENLREQMRHKMASEKGKEVYAARKQTVEPRIGMIKSVLGMRKFLRRGVEKVRVEMALACATVNVIVLLKNWKVVKPLIT